MSHGSNITPFTCIHPVSLFINTVYLARFIKLNYFVVRIHKLVCKVGMICVYVKELFHFLTSSDLSYVTISSKIALVI
jgi:hypothetical protein